MPRTFTSKLWEGNTIGAPVLSVDTDVALSRGVE